MIIQNTRNTSKSINWLLINQKIGTKLKLRDYIQHKNTKKSMLSCISFMMISCGITILSLVFVHFDFANSFCNQIALDSVEFLQYINITGFLSNLLTYI